MAREPISSERNPVFLAVEYWPKVDRSGGSENCHPWVGRVDKDGYGMTRLPGRHAQVRVHRWTYVMFVGSLADDQVVRHKCDNPPCQNPSHLIRGTQIDNIRDRVERKRGSRGEHRPSCKLKEVEVLEIFHSDKSEMLLSQQYAVSLSNIYNIRKGRRWAWLTNTTENWQSSPRTTVLSNWMPVSL